MKWHARHVGWWLLLAALTGLCCAHSPRRTREPFTVQSAAGEVIASAEVLTAHRTDLPGNGTDFRGPPNFGFRFFPTWRGLPSRCVVVLTPGDETLTYKAEPCSYSEQSGTLCLQRQALRFDVTDSIGSAAPTVTIHGCFDIAAKTPKPAESN